MEDGKGGWDTKRMSGGRRDGLRILNRWRGKDGGIRSEDELQVKHGGKESWFI